MLLMQGCMQRCSFVQSFVPLPLAPPAVTLFHDTVVQSVHAFRRIRTRWTRWRRQGGQGGRRGAAINTIDAELRARFAATHAGELREDGFTRERRTGVARQGWSEAWMECDGEGAAAAPFHWRCIAVTKPPRMKRTHTPDKL